MEFSTSDSIVEAMLQKIITYSFYLLFFLTPLFWTSNNYELFEYNKMILIYALTTIITSTWVLKMIQEKEFIFKRTILDIPLFLFLGAIILSTIFSIDPHTSIWGYYSRSNGGLLSIISYLLLYFAFVSNIASEKVFNCLKAAIFSGVIISIWGILEHFGVSLSCVILRGEFNDGCWIQDVQARVFATLGQPNWMAAYLAMLIFPSFYFLLTAKGSSSFIIYYLSLVTLYMAFTFTYSRGPTLGLIGGMTVFAFFLLFSQMSFLRKQESINNYLYRSRIKYGMTVLVSFLIINILFGSALTSFRLVSKFAAPVRPSIAIPVAPPTGTQLENGGTESGQIRFIVWAGALDIFKHFPLLGTGVETFAYSYYQFRPVAHNLTSEWDFLYNKAHNEFLNYLATTGIVGFGTYIAIILIFIFWCFRFLMGKQTGEQKILIVTLLAAYISYLVQEFFLFSVVITALFFFLFPAIAFVAVSPLKPLKFPIFNLFLIRPAYATGLKIVVMILSTFLLYGITQFWYADTLFNAGEKSSDAGNPGKAYNLLSAAVEINSKEPFYRSELGYAAASAATALSETDATLSAQLVTDAARETDFALKKSPKNVSYWRTSIRTYFELSTLDKKYSDKTLQAVDTSIKLAPTDPKLYLTKSTILQSLGRNPEAEEFLQKTIKLKPNYLEAYINLANLYKSEKKYDAAVNILKLDLKILPNDPTALNLLTELGKLGVSTESAVTK